MLSKTEPHKLAVDQEVVIQSRTSDRGVFTVWYGRITDITPRPTGFHLITLSPCLQATISLVDVTTPTMTELPRFSIDLAQRPFVTIYEETSP